MALSVRSRAKALISISIRVIFSFKKIGYGRALRKRRYAAGTAAQAVGFMAGWSVYQS